MTKQPRLEHVKRVRPKGSTKVVYYYFNTGQKVDGKPVYKRLPDMSAPNFWDVYAAYQAGRTKRATVEYTVARMADDYERGGGFRNDLSEGTKRAYRRNLDRIKDRLGALSPDTVTQVHVTAILDKEPWKAGTRNAFVATLGALYKWGRKRGKTTATPTLDMGRDKGGAHMPWPDDVLDAALEADDPVVRLAVHLFYYTGQRISDVVKMRWGDVRGGFVRVTQIKTSKALEIHVAQALQAELDATPKRGITILCRPNGKSYTANWLRLRLEEWTLAQGVKTVPHGLRKNAVIALLEAGCSVAEVAAITGQTFNVVEKYAAQISQRRMTTAAIHRLEHHANRKTGGKTP